ncbi:MAG: hypothetical protein M1829_001991 [Trizodia sp. TS-e1964]|nr:MAG: hypothetical protein M1829_001991 [Trizodia sp. TS-e1964]
MAAGLNFAEITKCLMKHINRGAIGPIAGALKGHLVIEETPTDIRFMAFLMFFPLLDSVPLNQFIVKIDRKVGSILSSESASIADAEMEAMCTEAGLGHLDAAERFTNGTFSVSCKVLSGANSYVVQLRSNGNMGTIHAIHQLINEKCHSAIPVPKIFKTTVVPSCNLLVQISAFVPGYHGT